jgi:hypothetical protein
MIWSGPPVNKNLRGLVAAMSNNPIDLNSLAIASPLHSRQVI